MPKLDLPPPSLVEDTSHPVLGASLGPYSYVVLGELGGLTQFGVHLETLPPGSSSSHRHWHETEDEFIYVVSGELILVEETETKLMSGDAAAWKAGIALGHCLENRSARDATYLVVGTRAQNDRVHYPDAGLTLTITGRRHRVFTDAEGRVVAAYER